MDTCPNNSRKWWSTLEFHTVFFFFKLKWILRGHIAYWVIGYQQQGTIIDLTYYWMPKKGIVLKRSRVIVIWLFMYRLGYDSWLSKNISSKEIQTGIAKVWIWFASSWLALLLTTRPPSPLRVQKVKKNRMLLKFEEK